MKKLISIMICLMMLATFVAAENFDRSPTPRPFEVYVFHEGKAVEGFNLEFTVNSQTVIKKTNSAGGVMVDWDLGYSSDFPLGKDITGLAFYSQVLLVRCGLSVCDNDYPFDGLKIPTSIIINLADAPVIVPEPEPTPLPTPEVVENVNSNEDDSIATIDVFYGEEINVVVLDNKLSKLQDKEIDFDNDDYNIHEEILLNAFIRTSLDDVDYGSVPYLVIPEGGLRYRYVFDDLIPNSKVEEDEVLEINFLGNDLEIVDKSSNSITILYGLEKDINEGDTFEGVTLMNVLDDYVKVSYDGKTVNVYDGQIEDIGDIEVMATYLANDLDGVDSATLRVAKDIKITIEDGDDYEEGEVWKWVITNDYFEIINQEEYDDLSEDYLPLAEGGKIVLPNDFATIKFNEVTKPELTELDISVKDSYLRIRGPKDSLADNYDEILINSVGIYDEDEVLISTDKVRIGESDVYIELGYDTISIGDLEINLDMSDIFYWGESYSLKDEVYLDYQGIIFKDPEEAVNDKSGFEVIVPDERPEVTITIGAEPEVKEGNETIDCPTTEEISCPAEKVCTVTQCPPCAKTECPSDTTPTEPEGTNLGAIIITAIAALLAGGFGGKYFTKNKALGTQGGLKTHMSRNGEEKVNHMHKGIRGYHDPYTSHRDEVERHPRGQMLPHYKQNEKGVWEYIK